MGDRMRRQSWKTSPLGPVEDWSPSLRTLADTVLDMGVPAAMTVGEASNVCVCNDAYAALVAPADSILARPLPSVWPGEQAGLRSLLERARRGEAGRHMLRLRPSRNGAMEGAECWFSPVRDETGGIVGVLNTVVPERQDETAGRADDTQRHGDSDRRLRALIEGIPQLVWRAQEPGNWEWASPQWEAYTGLAADRSTGTGWLDAVHPDDREKALASWRKAVGNGGFEAAYRIYHRSEDRYRWFQTRATPVRNERGAIIEWFGTSTDVDDLRRLHERESLLLFELQHRVRNTLAVIRSIARRTADHSDGVEDFASHLEGRIDAFARVETSLAQVPTGGLDLATMIADEFAAVAAREGREVTMEGPDIRLRPKAAELLGLSVHELTTNAIKDGALSRNGGHVRVGWSVEGGEAPMLRFEWKEKAVDPPGQPHKQTGFGSDLLRRSLVYELKASVDYRLEADGLHFAMAVPLSEIAAEEDALENGPFRNP